MRAQVFEGRRQVTNGKPEAKDTRAYNIGVTSRGVAALERFGVNTTPLAAAHGGNMSTPSTASLSSVTVVIVIVT